MSNPNQSVALQTLALPFKVAMLVGVMLLSVATAHAERADRDKPMTIEADAASYDDLQQLYKLSGNVVLTKGTMVLRSETAEVRIDPEGYQYATANGTGNKLAFIRQKREGLNQFIEGNAETIVYDGKAETSRLTNRARMSRLEGTVLADEIRGKEITYDSKAEFYTASGAENGATGGRVRAVLAPRKGSAVTATPAPATKTTAPAASTKP